MANSAPGGPGARAADGAGSGAADERVAAAVAELYDCDPQEFTDRRKALAAAARDAGDAAAAKRIGALRKPTRAAWVANRLARADPAAPARLAELASALRAAEQARNGPRLRELSAARGPLIDTLTRQALAVAGVQDPPAGLREEVEATLTAALADPEVAAAFAAGTLTRAAQWAGFGAASFAPGPGSGATPGDGEMLQWTVPPAGPAPPVEGETARRGRGSLRGLPSPADAATARQASGRPKRSGGGAAAPESARSVAEDARRAAEEAAQRAARRREALDDAERAVVTAAAATADAQAAEDRLEAEVRDLEDRLTRARGDLANTRRRARGAEAAERRARQALDRLPRP